MRRWSEIELEEFNAYELVICAGQYSVINVLCPAAACMVLDWW